MLISEGDQGTLPWGEDRRRRVPLLGRRRVVPWLGGAGPLHRPVAAFAFARAANEAPSSCLICVVPVNCLPLSACSDDTPRLEANKNSGSSTRVAI